MFNSNVDIAGLLVNFMKIFLDNGTMEIRDVDKGEEPYHYSSGWNGPGYILFKALVSHRFFSSFVMMLAIKAAAEAPKTTFVAGNVTGGVIPGWLLSQYLEILLCHPVRFMYVSETRDFEKARNQPIMIIDKIRLEKIAQGIATAAARSDKKIDFVAGGAPGGMILAYRVSEILSGIFNRHVPFVYVRETRKKGGDGEMVIGPQNNPFFENGMTGLAIGNKPGGDDDGMAHVMKELEEAGYNAINIHQVSIDNQLSDFPRTFFSGMERPLEVNDPLMRPDMEEGIVGEELTNFARSAIISTHVLERIYGLVVPMVARLLSYDQPTANQDLREEGLETISLFTLPELLSIAKKLGTHNSKLVKTYRQFLANPVGWNTRRGFQQQKR